MTGGALLVGLDVRTRYYGTSIQFRSVFFKSLDLADTRGWSRCCNLYSVMQQIRSVLCRRAQRREGGGFNFGDVSERDRLLVLENDCDVGTWVESTRTRVCGGSLVCLIRAL